MLCRAGCGNCSTPGGCVEGVWWREGAVWVTVISGVSAARGGADHSETSLDETLSITRFGLLQRTKHRFYVHETPQRPAPAHFERLFERVRGPSLDDVSQRAAETAIIEFVDGCYAEAAREKSAANGTLRQARENLDSWKHRNTSVWIVAVEMMFEPLQ